ncbi:MAG TPA: hypothetical protein VMC06_09585 [Opitutaceae bacterium]|nr:hypothetical protein [Opitutaceae bacterium]
MKPIFPILAWLLASSVAFAEGNLPIAPKAKSAAPAQSQWVFSLLPKSLQSNPTLELTVITEVTDEGKKLPPVSPDHPAYYIAQSAGYVQVGDTYGNEKTLPADELDRILKKSLAANGYLPAKPPAQPPTLAVIYYWGTDNLLNDDNGALSPDQVARNILNRAALVGGEKFAKELATLFEQADAMSSAVSAGPGASSDDGSGGSPGSAPMLTPVNMDFANPVNLFKMKSLKNEFLVDQASDDCYYVVASAYDYAAFAHKQRKLLWRTRMTVNSKGVSQTQSLPTLIISAAPYFGRDMPESEILSKRAKEGEITIGTPTVVEMPTAAPAKK